MPARLKLVFSKPSFLLSVIFTTLLYIFWTIINHDKIINSSSNALQSQTTSTSRINNGNFVFPNNNKQGYNTSSIDSLDLKPKSSLLPNYSKESHNNHNLQKNLIKNAERAKIKPSSTHTLIHGHVMRSRNSSIVQNGKIYGSHLKEDSQELILGKSFIFL